MGDTEVLARIDIWASEGLIDGPTAARLRAAELARNGGGDRPVAATSLVTAATARFGPGISVGEMFAYLGSGFLLAAWFMLISRLAGEAGRGLVWAFGLLVVAVVLVAIAFRIRDDSARFVRAAGVAFLVAGGAFGGAAYVLVDELVNEPQTFEAPPDTTAPFLAGAAVWLVAAAILRRLHPAILTQLGLVAAIVATSAALMRWLEPIVFGAPTFDGFPTEPESPVRVVLIAMGWGVTAVVLGVIGLAEARSRTVEAGGRAALTRVAAGLTAVLGTAGAVFASGFVGADEYDRLIPPLIGDALLIAVSAVLLERAFRRETSAFVLPAALGMILGLSDLNAQYLAEVTGPEIALLVEGVILLAAGVGFDRLRRRLSRRGIATDAPGSGAGRQPVEDGSVDVAVNPESHPA